MVLVWLENLAAFLAPFRPPVLQIEVIEERLVRRKTPGTDVAAEVSGFGFVASAGHGRGLRSQIVILKRGSG